MDLLVSNIEKLIQDYFPDKAFIKKDGFGLYRLVSSNTSEAKDLHKNYLEDTKVVKWYFDYWIKIIIQFTKIDVETSYTNQSGIAKKDYLARLSKNNLELNKIFFETNISLSLFKGEYDVQSKFQLFRAEWDSYESIQNKHPQPHWQFYQLNEYQEKLSLEFSNQNFLSSISVPNGFNEFLNNKFDFKKFHFAMNGNWTNDESHIHNLNSEQKIIKWLPGLLSHLKAQVEYLEQ
ncbi:hypothetical protein EZ449_04820 [Pedobacter frigidisoli]|uniref:Uncharacterized protein n=1 Tax=Pedobacter frigidisoli TaxID=2530455 RepID=A0A4R0P6R5_9SPHI|nr:hypothetical protein [Pedobacter frigidisoli]TCD11586.1 hypothetical protein EZ449_04820 [Pedobacter frigidisoli]